MQFRVARCVSVTLLLMANVVSAPLPRAAPFDAVAVDQFIATQMARHRIPGLAVAITRGDQVVHIRGYGEAHDGQPVTGQTLFRIASLSKSLLPWPYCNLLKSAKLRLMRRSSATCQTSIWQPPRRLNRLGPLVDEQSAVAGGARRPKCCLKARASKPSPAIKVVNLLVSHSSLNTNSLSVTPIGPMSAAPVTTPIAGYGSSSPEESRWTATPTNTSPKFRTSSTAVPEKS